MNTEDDTIKELIEYRNKNGLYNLYSSKKISIGQLVDAIIEIDDSVTDWYKFKKWIKKYFLLE